MGGVGHGDHPVDLAFADIVAAGVKVGNHRDAKAPQGRDGCGKVVPGQPERRWLEPEGIEPQACEQHEYGRKDVSGFQNLILARDSSETELAPFLPCTFI